MTDNFSQSIVDNAVRQNADFQWKSGLEPKIVRTAEYKCCKWCSNLEGSHRYEDVKDTGNDVFRRHNNCRCKVTYVPSKGNARDVWSKRVVDYVGNDLETSVNNLIQQKNVVYSTNNGKIVNVTSDFLKNRTNGYASIDIGYSEKRNKEEIECASLLNRLFGGEIICLTAINEQHIVTADYLWNGKLWDLKCPSTKNAINKRMQHGVKQISENPGGIILNMKNSEMSRDEFVKEVAKRMTERYKIIGSGYCIIIDGADLVKVLEYKK